MTDDPRNHGRERPTHRMTTYPRLMSSSRIKHQVGDTPTWIDNPQRDHTWSCEPVGPEVREFHRGISGYAPTNLIDLPELASEFGVRQVFAKDESFRLGLPAFKALGASWAIHRALKERNTDTALTLVAATDGNHGRAVAHFARQFGHEAEIFVPSDVHADAIQAIRDEGAAVTVLSGSYDLAVDEAIRHSERSDKLLLIQDTAREGYEGVPQWIVEGYDTLFAEIDDQLAGLEIAEPDLVVVPAGVGSLLQAAISHYRSDPSPSDTAIVSVEPTDSACVLSSVKARERVSIQTGQTVMSGLNCGTMSSLAWPTVAHGLDACVAVTDAGVRAAGEDLASMGVDAGPCGAASLAGARVATSSIKLSPGASIVLLVTEGSEANPWATARG